MARSTERNYRFEVNAPYNVISVIVRSANVEDARDDAYKAMVSTFGCRIGSIRHSNADAKIMRRMPHNTEVVRGCYTYSDDGVATAWAWFVYK